MRTVAPLVLAAGFIAACTHSGNPAPTSGSSSSTRAHVHVLGLWSGPELDSFMTVKSAWEKDTGASVEWEGTQDLPDALDADIKSGHRPDIAILPNLAVMRRLATNGTLIPLNSVLDMSHVARDYAPAWLELGSSEGNLYGIFYKVADKATVWYSPRAFAAAGYRVPKTWADLTTLADRIVRTGRAPFSIVAASGPASGWPLTDWISEIVLNTCGAHLYDRWISADIPWTDPCIKRSFELFDNVMHAKGYVLGGKQRILTTTDGDGANPLYTSPPSAYVYYLASFAQAFITSADPSLEPVHDYNFFPFPAVNPRYGGGITVGADVVVMVHNTPAARSFMAYLAGARAQEAWIKLGGFTSVNRSVALGTYPDPVAHAVAHDLTTAGVIRFCAGDMMPASLQQAWWAAMLDLVNDPSKLHSVLASLTGVARSAR